MTEKTTPEERCACGHDFHDPGRCGDKRMTFDCGCSLYPAPLADGREILTREEYKVDLFHYGNAHFRCGEEDAASFEFAEASTLADQKETALLAHDAALRAEVGRLTVELENARRERGAFRYERDTEKARAEKLAAALREIVDQTERGYCAEPCSTHIARSALAENGEEK